MPQLHGRKTSLLRSLQSGSTDCAVLAEGRPETSSLLTCIWPSWRSQSSQTA